MTAPLWSDEMINWLEESCQRQRESVAESRVVFLLAANSALYDTLAMFVDIVEREFTEGDPIEPPSVKRYQAEVDVARRIFETLGGKEFRS